METSTFVYDGDCAFCTSCAQFIERRIPTGARVVPWQFADLAALGAGCVGTAKRALKGEDQTPHMLRDLLAQSVVWRRNRKDLAPEQRYYPRVGAKA